MKVKNSNYELMGRWYVPTLAWAPCSYWNHGLMLKSLDMDSKDDMLTLSGFWISPRSVRKRIDDKINSALERSDFAVIDRFMKESIEVFNKVLSVAHDLDRMDKDRLVEAIEKFSKVYTELETPWIASIYIGDALQPKLIQDAKKEGYSDFEIMEFLKPIRKTLSLEQKEDMIKIRDKISKVKFMSKLDDLKLLQDKYPDIFEAMARHVKKYEWLGNLHFWGEPFNIKNLTDQIKRESSGKKSKDEIPSKLKKIFKIGSEISWVRQQSADLAALISYSLKPFLKKSAEILKIEYDQIIWMSFEEVISHLKSKSYPNGEVLDERKKGVGIYIKNNKQVIISGKELVKEMDKWLISEESNNEEIKGIIANKGKVTGIARIMLHPFSQNFKEGEILVTSETTPDFLPIMTKASAFLTEIGGITSHAAIVARELSKPCIISVKGVTNILRDGDLVEVNADKGIVKILKRN